MPNVRASSGMIGTTRWPNSSSRARLRSRRVKAIVVDAGLLARAAGELGERLVGAAARAGGVSRTTRLGSEPSSAWRRSIMYWYSARVRRPAGSTAGSSSSSSARRGSRREVEAVAERARAASLVIFLIWWVALRPSTSGPSVQPLTVLARITVGAPVVLGRGLVGGVELAVVVAAAGQVAQLVVGEVLDQSCAGAGRGRRSARGCRRRPRRRSAGTRRRRWCSSCRAARRRRRGRAARPTSSPR